MTTQCIITGVLLISPDRDEWVAGDLFRQEDTFIVNAVTAKDGNTRWTPIEQEDKIYTHRCLFLGTEFFERRGVFVMHVGDCELNTEALEYINAR